MVLQPPYNNACLDITPTNTPDPWIYQAHGKFYLAFTGGDRIPLWSSTSLFSFLYPSNHTRGPAWKSPQSGPQSAGLWAPELHCLCGRWYIYFAAMDTEVGNRTHRMYVLGGPTADKDPHEGEWELLGPIRGMDRGQWAIDGTVLELEGILWFVYSGWSRKEDGEWEDRKEGCQQLWILRLKDSITADSEPVMISDTTEDWEKLPNNPNVAINEGPQYLSSPSGHWQGLVYSCSASWTKHYKMATLRYLPTSIPSSNSSDAPLDPGSWHKSSSPLIQNRADGKGPYGPGHGCFLRLKGIGTVAVFHATDREDDGNRNRRARMQRLRWTEEGPDMGGFVGEVTGDVEKFLGRGQREEGK